MKKYLLLVLIVSCFTNINAQIKKIVVGDTIYLREITFNKKQVFEIKDNVPDGEYEIYLDDANTKLYQKGYILNGHKTKYWAYYFENGKIMSEAVYDFNGARNGKANEYYESGKIKKETEFLKGAPNGKSISYFENGKVWIDSNYKNGVFDGDYIQYNDKGEIVSKKVYLNGFVVPEKK